MEQLRTRLDMRNLINTDSNVVNTCYTDAMTDNSNHENLGILYDMHLKKERLSVKCKNSNSYERKNKHMVKHYFLTTDSVYNHAPDLHNDGEHKILNKKN
jgi:uncharacterized protein YfkK (UPF0435 family)